MDPLMGQTFTRTEAHCQTPSVVSHFHMDLAAGPIQGEKTMGVADSSISHTPTTDATKTSLYTVR